MPRSRSNKILIVDDEIDNRELVQQILQDEYTVISATDGDEGFQKAKVDQPDLILLDLNMPKKNGIVTCEALRTDDATKHIPIIMLTAYGDVDNRIRSYLGGADDFLDKPFQLEELLARVYSKMKRVVEARQGIKKIANLECGNLVLNLEKIEVVVSGKVIPLSVLEFNLLRFFLENMDRVVTREMILNGVWKGASVNDRTVDTHLVSLRKRLSEFNHSITTIYGAGYILKSEQVALVPESPKE